MFTFFREELNDYIYVMDGKKYFDELVQDAMDFDVGFWKPDADKFYTVTGQLVEVLDEQDTLERAIEFAKAEGYELVDMCREIIFGEMTTGFHELVEKYWGGSAFAAELEEATNEDENIETYAIYNDRIDDEIQLGTLTLKHNDEMTAYKVYKELIS